ncbi:AAA family ATPase [Kiloniella laminariae]|uniref:AAA family ATPase n=1 Tax=Kiloniella laminariae TaxID=454162 RepID=A0ABT4LPT8_9PROT|nr:AAA family ATPase [Kiloniella laminariae]MCZ4283138.1 AAA family ATPase [Kiloniella laminariae]
MDTDKKVVVVGSNKGGSGKTTTATNLAVALASLGRDVCLVDADPQRSSSRWNADREEAGHLPALTVLEKTGNLQSALSSLRDRFDFVIVDVPGRNSRELITGAAVADVLLAPHQASQLDLDTLEELQEQIQKITDLNPKLITYVYHAMASTNPSVIDAERRDFISFVSSFPEFKPLNAVGYHRKIYRDAIPQGVSVVELDNQKASDEIKTLLQEIFQWQ